MKHSIQKFAGRTHKFVFVLAFMIICCFAVNSAHAQQAAKTTSNTQDNLKTFEGYYQFQNDKNVYIQIMTKENHLVLKQLWDEKEITFDQKSDLEFASDHNGNTFPLKFTRDQNKEITQVLAFDRDVWVKVKNYKPVVKKEIQLTAQQLKAYEGKYTMKADNGEDFYLQFTPEGNNIRVQELWSGKEFVIAPETDLNFFGKKAYYPVKFTKDQNGVVTQALIFDKDVWTKVKE